MKTILYVVIGVVVGVLLAALVWLAASPPRGDAIELNSAPTLQPIMVHVTGAVPSPGLYYLPEGSRVNDAIEAAG